LLEYNQRVLTAHHNHKEDQQPRHAAAASAGRHMEGWHGDRNNNRKCSKPGPGLARPGLDLNGFNGNRRRRGSSFCLYVYLAKCLAVGLFDYFVAGSNNQVSSVIINISSSSCNNVIIGVLCSLSLSFSRFIAVY